MNKKAVIFIIINFFIIKNFYSTDFSKDNGKIILQKNENNIQTIIRKCELEVIVGDMLNPQRRVIYDGIYKKNVLGNLVDNDKIKILELCSVKYFAEPKKRNTYKGDLWYKISFNGGTGWICYYYNKYEHHPFEENEYKRSTIEIDGKLKKIRELNQVLSVFDNLDILDLPSI